MKAQYLNLLGLLFDIVGALLLSIEAIKIDNFRLLYDKVFKPTYDALVLPREQNLSKYSDDREFLFFWYFIYIAIYLIIGSIILAVIISIINYKLFGNLLFNHLLYIFKYMITWPWYAIIICIILIIVVIIPIIFLIMGLLGRAFHEIIARISKYSINFLQFIFAKTPSGTIGILGFLLLFIGFVCQIIATYLSI